VCPNCVPDQIVRDPLKDAPPTVVRIPSVVVVVDLRKMPPLWYSSTRFSGSRVSQSPPPLTVHCVSATVVAAAATAAAAAAV
jgi:hypothetical protein